MLVTLVVAALVVAALGAAASAPEVLGVEVLPITQPVAAAGPAPPVPGQ